LLRMGRYEESILAFEKADALEPDLRNERLLAKAHSQYGVSLGQRNKLDAAEKQFLKALQLDPGNAFASSNYGTLLARMGRDDEAINQFREAIRLAPDEADLYDKVGVILGRTGKTAASVEYLEKAVALQPDHWLAREHLAYAYFYKEDYVRAWAEVHQIQNAGKSINPKFLDTLNSRMADPAGS